MVSLLAAVVLSPTVAPGNLIANGDFASGFKGFTSQYRLTEDVSEVGTYALTADPTNVHPGAVSMADHTGKSGAMLVANGSEQGSATLLQTTVKVSPGKTYAFSGWAASWSHDMSEDKPIDVSPAKLLVLINDKAVGTAYQVNPNSGTWGKFSFKWNSGTKTSAVIRIVNANLEGVGNDFAIDDLSLVLIQ